MQWNWIFSFELLDCTYRFLIVSVYEHFCSVQRSKYIWILNCLEQASSYSHFCTVIALIKIISFYKSLSLSVYLCLRACMTFLLPKNAFGHWTLTPYSLIAACIDKNCQFFELLNSISIDRLVSSRLNACMISFWNSMCDRQLLEMQWHTIISCRRLLLLTGKGNDNKVSFEKVSIESISFCPHFFNQSDIAE